MGVITCVRCRGCLRRIKNNGSICESCGRQCNICDVRMLRTEMTNGRCVGCMSLMSRLVTVHFDDNWQKSNPLKARLVEIYRSRVEDGLDIFTGKPRKVIPTKGTN